MQKRGTAMRKPKLISVICPVCGEKNKEIPKDMGDQIVKCSVCGRTLAYRFRTGKIEAIEIPERDSSSGQRIY